MGLDFTHFDLICGTSLIKALSGDASRTKDDYYLQKNRDTLCCLHVPRSFHTDDDAGHAVERLLCGGSGQGHSFVAASAFRIGEIRVLVTSEVDASDPKGGLVELKSSNVKEGQEFVSNTVALQIALNGSDFVLGCTLDKDKSRLEAVEWISSTGAIERHRESHTRKGQRVRLLLERLVHNEHFTKIAGFASSTDMGPTMKLRFDDIKAPVIEPSEADVIVWPDANW